VARTGIQRHYVDALGRRHRPPASSVATIEAAMRGGASANADVIVVRDGERPSIGPAELRLEDGTTRIVDEAAADLPHGYPKSSGHPSGRLDRLSFRGYLPPGGAGDGRFSCMPRDRAGLGSDLLALPGWGRGGKGLAQASR
jgi:hypothetical protein